MARYADVAVELPVAGTFTYRVPAAWPAAPAAGARVVVPFGNRRISGVVLGDGEPPEDRAAIRDIASLVDAEPQLSRQLIDLCRWIADYYMAPLGEVLRAALPAGTRVRTPVVFALTDEGKQALAGQTALPAAWRDVLATLDASGGRAGHKALCRGRVRASHLRALEEAGLITAAAKKGATRIRARTVRIAILAVDLSAARSALAKKKAKLALVEHLAAAGGEAEFSALRTSFPQAPGHLKQLAKDGLVTIAERTMVPDAAVTAGAPHPPPPALTDDQTRALAALIAGLDSGTFSPALLFGVTGSGKTEVYLRAIAAAIERGRTAIVLVPEISLTPQLAARFRARFGDQVAVLHSGLSLRARMDEWQRLRSGAARIAVGARSAVFAPVDRPAIIVVDEEHDSSFKQEEGVRYCARDVALVRAKRAGAVCVLGSATPSMESFSAATAGRYQLLRMPERATPRPLPEVAVIDFRTYQPERESMITAPLATAIEGALERGDQAILFLNRRGFSTFIVCVGCGHAFRCAHCSVSLTFHQTHQRMMCHYCGYTEPLPAACPGCGGTDTISRRGLGTEKIAARVSERFAGARVGRLDRDVGGSARVEAILARFAAGELDILVGTQMVTKGHDFPRVTVVGVLCADVGLSLPDFRAAERGFQLLTQVAGRAGRGDGAGRVLIQTYRPDSPAIACARKHDYEAFFGLEKNARESLGYPPFGHMIAIRIDGADPAKVAAEARRLGARASDKAGPAQVLGPCEAPLARLRGRFRWQLWLRCPERREVRALCRHVLASAPPPGAGVRVAVDVDPISAL
ncbi:MAG TPA: primosomal protein N' [Kofleriaceae bacterium]|nr:primosomal protein N' [Kofleriaceae bacterium]